MTIDTTPITAPVAVTVFVSLAGNMLAEWLSDLTAQGRAGLTAAKAAIGSSALDPTRSTNCRLDRDEASAGLATRAYRLCRSG